MSKQERPWGSWEIVARENGRVVKILTVNPGQMLSLQRHGKRDEQWQALDYGLIAYQAVSSPTGQSQVGYTSSEATALVPGSIFTVSRCHWHRLINPTDRAVSLVEVITGVYDEEDIFRIHDNYERADNGSNSE